MHRAIWPHCFSPSLRRLKGKFLQDLSIHFFFWSSLGFIGIYLEVLFFTLTCLALPCLFLLKSLICLWALVWHFGLSLWDLAPYWDCASCQLDSFGTGSFVLAVVLILSEIGLSHWNSVVWLLARIIQEQAVLLELCCFSHQPDPSESDRSSGTGWY